MRWMWIDRIIEHDPGKRLVAIKNTSLAEDHLHDHLPATADKPAMPLMPASLIVEGMAQTAGIMVGAVNNFREKVILAKISKAEFAADILPGMTLRYTATMDRIDEAGAVTRGIVEARTNDPGLGGDVWQSIGRINLMFSHVDQNMAGLEFPEENFVFGENFKAVWGASGLVC
ncbi:MAG: beta-hydroxyacyl-ACP dehydratase [Planctomycetes bacterium]|nr:beta-hydroxyacyl-ACP dehydratase [Planctomycetota bacterium]